jgi:F0F1-type ATP synthase assembly protein I
VTVAALIGGLFFFLPSLSFILKQFLRTA